jgi:hypothetical protein
LSIESIFAVRVNFEGIKTFRALIRTVRHSNSARCVVRVNRLILTNFTDAERVAEFELTNIASFTEGASVSTETFIVVNDTILTIASRNGSESLSSVSENLSSKSSMDRDITSPVMAHFRVRARHERTD